jgi:hypothetical protein
MARTYHAGEGGSDGRLLLSTAMDGSRRRLHAMVLMGVIVMVQMMMEMIPEMMVLMPLMPLRPECARGHKHQQ